MLSTMYNRESKQWFLISRRLESSWGNEMNSIMEVNEKEISKIPVEGGLLFSYRFCVVEAQRKKEIGIG